MKKQKSFKIWIQEGHSRRWCLGMFYEAKKQMLVLWFSTAHEYSHLLSILYNYIFDILWNHASIHNIRPNCASWFSETQRKLQPTETIWSANFFNSIHNNRTKFLNLGPSIHFQCWQAYLVHRYWMHSGVSTLSTRRTALHRTLLIVLAKTVAQKEKAHEWNSEETSVSRPHMSWFRSAISSLPREQGALCRARGRVWGREQELCHPPAILGSRCSFPWHIPASSFFFKFAFIPVTLNSTTLKSSWPEYKCLREIHESLKSEYKTIKFS